jgi:hypothetical protein
MRKALILVATIAMLAACQESLEERAAREARQLTETKCPMPVSKELYLDSVVFDIPTLTQTQYFRFIGGSDNDSIISDEAWARQMLVAELKNTPSYRELMGRGATFHYVYRSTKTPDKVLFETTLTKEDYTSL